MDNNIKNNLWLNKNCINNNLDYIEKLLNNFSIYNWKSVINIKNGNDLILICKSINYKIKIREDILALELYVQNTNLNSNNTNNNEIFCIVKNAGENGCFYGDDCWYNIIKCIKGRKLNGK